MLEVCGVSAGPNDFGLMSSETAGNYRTASHLACGIPSSVKLPPEESSSASDGPCVITRGLASCPSPGSGQLENVYSKLEFYENTSGGELDLGGNNYDANVFGDSTPSFECCQQDSGSDDMFMAPLDELLQSDCSQAFVGDSSFAGVDDLFPSLDSASQDFLHSDAWSIESLQDLETSLSPILEDISSTCDDADEEQSVSQIFSEWPRTNGHCISLSDLRKIKLKTSTIENATQRLGGGKKGLLLFVRFVLMWVQNCHTQQVDLETMVTSTAGLEHDMSFGFAGRLEKDDFPDKRATEAQGSGMNSHNVRNMSNIPEDWRTSNSDWMLNPSSSVEYNFAGSKNMYESSGASFPVSQSDKTWTHKSVPPGGRESSLMPIPMHLRPPMSTANNLVRQSATGNNPNLAMMFQQQQQQQQCPDATPAATTRAARKSRMERQRWSVRQNRKWSLGSRHRHHISSASASYVGQSNVHPWSQFMSTSAIQRFSHSNLRPMPRPGKPTIGALQTEKEDKHLRLLFHKDLKQSDVGNLGRIVVPKKAAETCLPPLELRDGINLAVEDYLSGNVWNMRYRFWPNNKSRMYLLENTGDFVKSHKLKEGDYIMLYFNLLNNRYVIRGAQCQEVQCGMDASLSSSVLIVSNNTSTKTESDVSLVTNSSESCEDSLLAELIEQTLDDIRDSSETEISNRS